MQAACLYMLHRRTEISGPKYKQEFPERAFVTMLEFCHIFRGFISQILVYPPLMTRAFPTQNFTTIPTVLPASIRVPVPILIVQGVHKLSEDFSKPYFHKY